MITSDSRVPTDRADLTVWARRERVEPAETFDGAIEAACTGRARIVVTDLDTWPPGAARQVVQQLKTATTAATLIVRTDLTARALAELPLLSDTVAAVRIRVAFRAHCPLLEWLALDTVDQPQSATFAILQRFYGLVPAPARPAFVATTVMCGQLVTLEEIGARLGMREDKLRALYRLCRSPTFPDTNATLLAAHALTLADGGAAPEAVASRTGFDNLAAMNKYLARHFHRSLKQLVKDGGAVAMLDRMARWFEG